MYYRIASYSGVKLVGDPLGAKYNLVSDYDCKINRSGVTIAEVKLINQQQSTFIMVVTNLLLFQKLTKN